MIINLLAAISTGLVFKGACASNALAASLAFAVFVWLCMSDKKKKNEETRIDL